MASIGEAIETEPRPQAAGLARWAAIAALGVRIGAAALAYLLQILLARGLGAAEYGAFSFTWSIVSICGFLATLGFGQIAVRFLAEYHERGEAGLARQFVRHTFIVTMFGSLATAVVLYTLAPLLESGSSALPYTALLYGLLAIPFFALTDVFEGFARSQGWTVRALAPAYLLRTGLVMASIAIALWFGWALDATSAMVLMLCATIAAALLQMIWTLPPLMRLFPDTPKKAARGIWNRAAWPTLLADLASLARHNADLILLGLLAPPAVVGVYFAATRIASLIGLVEFAIGASFGHRFAREAAAGQSSASFREAQRWMRLAGVGGALVLGAATPVILMLFGESFTAAIWPTWLLLAATAIRMVQGPLEDLLTMTGFPADVWHANLIGALVTTILCLLLAGPWQATGAAIGAAIGNLAAGLAMELAHRRRLGKDRVA